MTLFNWLKLAQFFFNFWAELNSICEDGKNVAALNLFLDAAAGDDYELVFAVTNTAVSIETIAELTTPYARPATPSAIVTVTPIGA